MNIEQQIELIKKQDGLSNTLGMEFISTPEPDTLMAQMKVDKLNRQVFGFFVGRRIVGTGRKRGWSRIHGPLSRAHLRGHKC